MAYFFCRSISFARRAFITGTRFLIEHPHHNRALRVTENPLSQINTKFLPIDGGAQDQRRERIKDGDEKERKEGEER